MLRERGNRFNKIHNCARDAAKVIFWKIFAVVSCRWHTKVACHFCVFIVAFLSEDFAMKHTLEFHEFITKTILESICRITSTSYIIVYWHLLKTLTMRNSSSHHDSIAQNFLFEMQNTTVFKITPVAASDSILTVLSVPLTKLVWPSQWHFRSWPQCLFSRSWTSNFLAHQTTWPS